MSQSSAASEEAGLDEPELAATLPAPGGEPERHHEEDRKKPNERFGGSSGRRSHGFRIITTKYTKHTKNA